MSPKVADKELVASASAVLAAGKEKWFGQFTREGIDKATLSASAQSALGEDVKAYQRLSALSKVIAGGKATEAQKSEAAELVKKLDGANSSEAALLETAKSAKNSSPVSGSTTSTGTPSDQPNSTKPEDEKFSETGGVDPKDLFCQVGPGQGGGGQQDLTSEQIISKMREKKLPALMDAADELEEALRSEKSDRVQAAQTCLSIYMRSGESQEFNLAMSGFRANSNPTGSNRVTQSQIDKVTKEMNDQLSGASLPEDPTLKPALTTLGTNIAASIDALSKLDRTKEPAKWQEAQDKLQQSLDIYVSLKDFDSRNRQQHLRDAYDNMNRARALLGLTEIKLTMESRVNREISGNELQYNRNTADSNIERGRTDAGNMTLREYTSGVESGNLSLNEAAGGSKTLKEYARNSADTEQALLQRDRARNERGREGLKDRRERIRLTRETIGEVKGTIRETQQTIGEIKKDPVAGIVGAAAILDSLKGGGKPPKGW